jgi:hypothetical protein
MEAPIRSESIPRKFLVYFSVFWGVTYVCKHITLGKKEGYY